MSASDKKKLRKEQENAALTEKQRTQQKEDKQLKRYTLTFIVVMVLVVAIAVTSVGVNWYNNSGIPANSTVALTVNGTNLSNVDLNYYYIDTINQFYSELYEQYSSYTTFYTQYLYGLDMSSPLNAQMYNEETGTTWADYFVDSAIESATSTYVLYNAAQQALFELPEEYQTSIASALSNLTQAASYYKYPSVESYLKDVYGNGASEESYLNYYMVNATAEAYYSSYAESLTYTPEEIDTYNNEHFNDFSSFDYSYFYVPASHYLPEKEADTTEATEAADSTEATEAEETYTAEELAAAAASAKAAAEQLSLCKDLEILNTSINKLEWTAETAKASEVNSTSASNIGTLYADWVTDTARKAGDTTVVEYESESDDDEDIDGYYVVLFEGRKDYTELMRSARHILVMFEGGSTDDDGNTVYSEEEKATAKAKADQIYNEWLNGEQTEESFIALVTTDNSDDGGSNTNGGLYEGVAQGDFVAEFDEWIYAEEGRSEGDTALIRHEGDIASTSSYWGYHVTYFQGWSEAEWQLTARSQMSTEDMDTWSEELANACPATLHDAAKHLGK